MGNNKALVCLAVALSVCNVMVAGELDQDERDALVALYESTNGPDWYEDRNWMGNGDICGWHGITCCRVFCQIIAVRAVLLKGNNLVGAIPPEIGGLWDLRVIELHHNHLSGEIPSEIGQLAHLRELYLHRNDLSGPIPVEMGGLLGLSWLMLGENRFSGPIPHELLNLEYLEFFILEDNELSGSLPAGLFDMSRLWVLDLSSNRFEGPVPQELTDVQTVDLSSNRFSGPIPEGVVDFEVMRWVDLRWNALYSNDPEVVAFLDARQEGGDWQSTQTIAPAGLTGRLTVDGTAHLSWSPITYQDDPGAYEIYHARSGDDWQLVGTTESKADRVFTVNGLEDGISHHLTVRSVTEPHPYNKNRVVSDPAPPLTLSSAGQLAIPAVARFRGVGVLFSSSLTAFNFGDSDLEIGLSYTPRADIGGQSRTATWTLAAGTAETVDDALGHFFGLTDEQRSVGSLVLSVGNADPSTLMVQTVITAHHGDGAEYGQIFPASAFSEAVMAGQTAHLHTTVDVSRSRVNAGFMALENGTTAKVWLVDPIGNKLGDTVFELTGSVGDNNQLNDVYAAFGVEPVSNVLIEATVDGGSLLAYASVLDGTTDSPGTSDPTTILPFVEGRSDVLLLEMGSIQGYDEFGGSASITNTAAEEAVITATFYQRGQPGEGANTTLTLQPGSTWGSERVISELFGIAGVVGTTVLTATEGSIAATGREYSIRRGSTGEVVGTAGQLMAGLTPADRLDQSTAWHFIGLRQDRERGRERTNFAAFNGGSDRATLAVQLYDAATGRLEGGAGFTLQGEELMHVNDFIATIDPEHDEEEKRIRVEVSGRVYMQVFRVNSSGDPVTLSAFEGP